MKRFLLLLFVLLIFAAPITACADTSDEISEINDTVQRIFEWQDSFIGSGEELEAHIGENYCDWLIFGKCRFVGTDEYKDAVNDYYLQKKDSLSLPDTERLSIVYSACGGDISENGMLDAVMGALHNSELHEKIVNQLIFALITADTGRYSIDGEYEVDRSDIISEILSRQTECGALYMIDESIPETDLTAMAVTALSPYIGEDEKTAAAVDRMIDYLSNTITDDGTAKNWGKASCESTSQVLTALCSAGIDPLSDSRFIKNGHTLKDGLMSYNQPDGSFAHNEDSNGGDAYATAQALYSLCALVRFENGYRPLYDLRSESENDASESGAHTGTDIFGKHGETEVLTEPNDSISPLTQDEAKESVSRSRVRSSGEVIILILLALSASGTIVWNNKVLKRSLKK